MPPPARLTLLATLHRTLCTTAWWFHQMLVGSSLSTLFLPLLFQDLAPFFPPNRFRLASGPLPEHKILTHHQRCVMMTTKVFVNVVDVTVLTSPPVCWVFISMLQVLVHHQTRPPGSLTKTGLQYIYSTISAHAVACISTRLHIAAYAKHE